MHETQTLKTPCLLPDLRAIVQIKTKMDRFYPLELNFDAERTAVDYFKNGTFVYILRKNEEEHIYRSVEDVQTALSEKMEQYNSTGKTSISERSTSQDVLHKDPVMMELKSKLAEVKTSTFTQSDNYNIELLCSDEYSGHVADYNIETWRAKHPSDSNQ